MVRPCEADLEESIKVNTDFLRSVCSPVAGFALLQINSRYGAIVFAIIKQL